MQKFVLKSFLIAVGLCSIIGTASGCTGLHFSGNSPTVRPQSDVNVTSTVQFTFTHDNDDGEYTCFVSDQERCPQTTEEQDCEQNTPVSFSGLEAGVWYKIGCRCRFGGVVRTITRSFGAPAQSNDCNAYLINDGISFFNYTADGDATTCFMWDSTGSPTGFSCSIDSGIPFTCESPLYRELDVTQHKIRIMPDGCPGDARAAVRRFEVPMEGCNLPFSIN